MEKEEKSTLNFISREDFSKFNLKEKNAYLQELADTFAREKERKPITLDKSALSRLRRYYSRRVWADLKLENISHDPLNDALRRLGESIRHSAIKKDVTAALYSETRPSKILREAPDDDAQLMFFVPLIYDAPIKDDINLMDVAPFSLHKRAKVGMIQYELKDSLITVEGGAECGLATVFDYDIFLSMVSSLAEQIKMYRIEEGKGLKPSLPSKVYRPNASHILKFCRRSNGGRQYDEIEAALTRLSQTIIRVRNLSNGKRRQMDSRPLIGEYRVVSKTTTGKVGEVEIVIPDWVYKSITTDDSALPLLTLNRDYFLITSGIGRFIYRLARKAAGKSSATYSVREIYKRSGSTQEYRFFLRDFKQFVTRTQTFEMPDYDLHIKSGKSDDLLVMTRRDQVLISSEK